MKTISNRIFFLFSLLALNFINGYSGIEVKPLIFPLPAEISLGEGAFMVDRSAYILVPEKPSEKDLFLSGLLLSDISDKYEQPISIRRQNLFSEKDRFILIGDISNPLVKKYCEQKKILSELKNLGNEGYILTVSPGNAVVAANTKEGALYGLESLRQIIKKEQGNLLIHSVIVKDSPHFAFRGIKLYLPGRENITFFKRFISDFAALYKFNKIILELNGNMRLERHPELNIGAVQFYRYLNDNRLERPAGVHKEFQNSSHQDNADGGILEKEEVAGLVAWMRKFNIEVIPEIPSLTHAYYLLPGHGDLAENMAQPFPDTYCPLKPEIYKIYFDVLEEYIDVIHPSVIHIGHDEWRMEKDLCELCRGKDYGQLFADDITKIHDYLAKKGIRTAIWGDHLLESVRKKDHQEWKTSTGYKYNIPGALTPEQVLKSIPKDILVFNWFWNDIKNDRQVNDFGFEQVYGNFTPDIQSWDERAGIKSLLGGAPSSWAATTERNFGKDQIFDFLGTANLLWSRHYLTMEELPAIVQSMMPDVRRNLSGKTLPSGYPGKVNQIDISSYFNSAGTPAEAIIVGNKSDKRSVEGISIMKDVNSIIFLHACEQQGRNDMAYKIIHNFDETAELLGWYEIIYEDGFTTSIPLRYGINILDWKWARRTALKGKEAGSQKYVYEADAIDYTPAGSDPVTFFAYEWVNPRLGKKVRSINIFSAGNSKNQNAIILHGIKTAETSLP